MAKQNRKVRRVNIADVLIVLFVIGSLAGLLIGFIGLLHGAGSFIFGIQNIMFGAVLAVSAYSLRKGTRRVWWLVIILYIFMGIVISAYLVYSQGQIISLAKLPIYLVILVYMMTPKVKNWFAV